jgi:hypothetical protein
MINNEIVIQQTDGCNCGPIAAVYLWALYADYDSCMSTLNGLPISSYCSAVVSHLEHLVDKHQSSLSCHWHSSVGNIVVDVDGSAAGARNKKNTTENVADISPKQKVLREEAYQFIEES